MESGPLVGRWLDMPVDVCVCYFDKLNAAKINARKTSTTLKDYSYSMIYMYTKWSQQSKLETIQNG